MAKITFQDKQNAQVIDAPAVRKVAAEDMNEIKESVNDLYDSVSLIAADVDRYDDEIGNIEPMRDKVVGALFFSANTAPTTIPVMNEWVEFGVESTTCAMRNAEKSGTNGIRYTGEAERITQLHMVIELKTLANNQEFEIGYFINGNSIAGTSRVTIRQQDTYQTAALLRLCGTQPGQTITPKIRNVTSDADCIISSF